MAWTKVADVTPPEDEPILIYDQKNTKIEIGRFISGHWFTEDVDGQLTEIASISHWCWILESQTYDPAND